MAAINFPDSPTLNQQATLGGYIWQWNGSTWRKLNTGKSAYDIAVENGFTGTEVQWLASLQGEDGVAGATGATGATGPQGPAGAPTRTIRSVSSSTTLQSGDLNQAIRFTGTSAQVLTINDVLTPGTSVEVLQDNSGSVEFQSGAGVTLLSRTGVFLTSGQNSVVTIRCVASGEYRLSGELLEVIPFVATGGTVTTSGDYTIHTFASSGTFQITSGTRDVDYLIVAGGGGGGTSVSGNDCGGGGGGAGGYRTGAFTGLTVNSYPITVGAGGPGLAFGSTSRANGGDSSFNSITSLGGGQGGNRNGVGPTNGGSGAGSCCDGSGPGLGTVGQGNNGGGGAGTASGASYGGGGAGGTGGSGGSGGGGAGGAGLASSITGSSVFYAGGGGGGQGNGPDAPGTGGSGVGGNGATKNGGTPTAGTQNRGGGGGGGGGFGGPGGAAGGSGIVIVRYLTNV